MRKRLWLPVAFFAMVISGGQGFAEAEVPSLKWSGFSSLRMGQIVKGSPETIVRYNVKSENVWVQEMNVGLNLMSEFENFPAVGNLGIEMAVCNDNSPAATGDFGTTRRLNFYPYLSRADLLFTIADGEGLGLKLDVGYFPYKYNSSVRNLGEYLFRTGTYPQYIITEIDFPMARLMGARFGGTIGETFNFDVLLTSNVEWVAIGDVNLTGIASWKPHPVVEMGVGASWCSLISVDWDRTTPAIEGSSSEYLAIDKNTGDTALYNYTFAGQKLMGRITLDVKQLFPDADVFGEEDLKLYAEGAVLGVVNYPVSKDGITRYDNIMERIPVMFGINVPTFKLLDVFSCELEYFGNPYVNNLNPIKMDNQPVPISSSANEKGALAEYTNRHDDDIKWSFYAKKTIASNLFIVSQIASDHIRWYRLDYTKMDGKEALRKIDQWYYTFKFGYLF